MNPECGSRSEVRCSLCRDERKLITPTGNAARIRGTPDLQFDSTGVTNPDLDWECTLNRTSVKGANTFQSAGNYWTLCKFEDLPSGQHTVGLIVKTEGRRFWFDYIEYQPIGMVDNQVLRASRNDLDLSYEGSWAALADVAQHTMVKGSHVTFKFIGEPRYVCYPQYL